MVVSLSLYSYNALLGKLVHAECCVLEFAMSLLFLYLQENTN